jgi:hypothetical protein
MPIQDMNTSASIYKKGEALKKLAALHLFVETLPVNKAVQAEREIDCLQVKGAQA